MKTLLLVISLVFMTTVSVNANDIEIEKDWALKTSLYKTIISDPESIVQSGGGVQVSLHRKSLFLYLSKDTNQVRFAGQSGPDVSLWSAGIGMRHKLDKHLTLSVDVGWYEPVASWLGEPQIYPDSGPFSEGLCRYLNKFLVPDESYLAWDYYSLNYRGGVGGKVSLNFEYPITSWLSFNMITGYRYLKLEENVQGRFWSNGNDWASTNYWTVRYDRDFSGWMIGGMFVFKF